MIHTISGTCSALLLLLVCVSAASPADQRWAALLDRYAESTWHQRPEVPGPALEALRAAVPAWTTDLPSGDTPWPCITVFQIGSKTPKTPIQEAGIAIGDLIYTIAGSPIPSFGDLKQRRPRDGTYEICWRHKNILRRDTVSGLIGIQAPSFFDTVQGEDWTPVVLSLATQGPGREDLLAAAIGLAGTYGRDPAAALALIGRAKAAGQKSALIDLLQALGATQLGDQRQAAYAAIRVVATAKTPRAVRMRAESVLWQAAALLADADLAAALTTIKSACPAALDGLIPARTAAWVAKAEDIPDAPVAGDLRRDAISAGASYDGSILDTDRPFNFPAIQPFGNCDMVVSHPGQPGPDGFRLSVDLRVRWRDHDPKGNHSNLQIDLEPIPRRTGALPMGMQLHTRLLKLRVLRQNLLHIDVRNRLAVVVKLARSWEDWRTVQLTWWQGVLRIAIDGQVLAALAIPSAELPAEPAEMAWCFGVSSGGTDQCAARNFQWDALGTPIQRPFHLRPEVAAVFTAACSGDIAGARTAWSRIKTATVAAGYAREAGCMPAYFDRLAAYFAGKAIELPVDNMDLWLLHDGDFCWYEQPAHRASEPRRMTFGMRKGHSWASYPIPFADGTADLTWANATRRLHAIGMILESDPLAAPSVREPLFARAFLRHKPDQIQWAGMPEAVPVADMPTLGFDAPATMSVTRTRGRIAVSLQGKRIVEDAPFAGRYQGWFGVFMLGRSMFHCGVIDRLQLRRAPLTDQELTALREAAAAAAKTDAAEADVPTTPVGNDF